MITWCLRALPGMDGHRLAKVALALVRNAHHHSRSGEPGGTVRVVLDRGRAWLPHLLVIDDGPPDPPHLTYPRLERVSAHSGLALVERLTVYWDWSWRWNGAAVRPLTVHAVLESQDR
ncbi:ATP-binding protein [Nocardiopsis sp. MG754419]|uniref:ATP-binding protein n=1 Tax=Nocardiopsis sp. MG754419 TaxID=2259865 RepID=UPI001BA6B56F|nr:ATP-binding protein [Nocardiopsis sp. MG754419]MBR8741742.1 hypothetical protein [Nocardiopsis sp. MG754419]